MKLNSQYFNKKERNERKINKSKEMFNPNTRYTAWQHEIRMHLCIYSCVHTHLYIMFNKDQIKFKCVLSHIYSMIHIY